MPAGVPTGLMEGCDHFGLDGYRALSLATGPMPAFRERVLEQDDETVVFRDGWGRTRRALKTGVSMDQYLRFPVSDRRSLARVRARFVGDPVERYPADWHSRAADLMASDFPVTLLNPLAGTFGYYSMLRNLIGTERLSYLWHDDPGLIEACLDFLTEFATALFEKALREVRFDFYYIHEDMSYKNGPLVSPAAYRQVVLESYRPVLEVLRRHGVDTIVFTTYGNTRALLPDVMVSADAYAPAASVVPSLPSVAKEVTRISFSPASSMAAASAIS
jgi:uroporphyrinogen decarboxylase